MNPVGNTAVIILAAGNSSRLGKPKQQLRFYNGTLLERAVQAAVDSIAQSVVVVLGAYHEKILNESDLRPARIVLNPNWNLGMGSSIKIGVNEILKYETPDRIILMLCDQPFVDGQLLTTLICTQQNTGKGIIACSYRNTIGVPVLFGRHFYSFLLEMEDSEGAKKIIQQLPGERNTIPFDQGYIDIDTAEDYQQLMRKKTE